MLLGFGAVVLVGLALTLTPTVRAWCIKDTYVGTGFFDTWTWETLDDPTHGRVNYVDLPTAQRNNLSYASDTKFVMRADASNIVPPSARGRDSVRITSRKSYADSLVVLDLEHMPVGCGTWPAFWTLSRAGPWPNGGEIDVIEGVHTNTVNMASLHSTPGLTMSEPRGQNGQTVSTTCDTSINSNQGCGTSFSKPASYGTAFNAARGGYFVLVRSEADCAIAVYFWGRGDPGVPRAVREGGRVVNVDESWGVPEARFGLGGGGGEGEGGGGDGGGECAYGRYFDRHIMIFDTTFCGDWAGATFASAGCPGSCNAYVNGNPDQFGEAYWEVNSLRVYV